MKGRFLISIAMIALAGTGLITAAGQQPTSSPSSRAAQTPAEEDEVVRITTNLVQVDVVVTDKDGRPVTDLAAEDFEVLEDGRPQRITNFAYIDLGSRAVEPTSARRETNAAVPVPPRKVEPGRARRIIAVVVDDLSLSFESTAFVRDDLKKFVRDAVGPDDLVAIVRTSAGVGALQQFTTDKRQLYAAIERIRWYPLGRGGISAFAPIRNDSLSGGLSRPSGEASDGQTAAATSENANRPRGEEALEEFREEIFTVGTLGALNFVIRGLRELPGRKAVVLVSDGIPIFNRSGESTRVLDALRRLVDLANRASAVIYTVDARGLPTLGLTAADDVSGMTAEEIERRLNDRRSSYFESQNGLNYLAQQTGGLFIRNTNDIAKGIRRVLDDQRGYYLLGYRPEDATFDQSGRRRFHRITVRVRRAGLRVRSRTGFYGVPDEEARPVRRTRTEQLMAALTSPFASGEIDLRLTSIFVADPKFGPIVRSLLLIDGSGLTWQPEKDSWSKSVMDVWAITFDADGRPVSETNRTYTMRARGEMIEAVRRSGLIYTMNVPVKRPGAYQLRIAVRDAASERIGSANRFIEVPDLKKKRLALSGIVLAGSLPREDDQKEGEAAVATIGPAVRRFPPGATIDYGFVIYNPKLDEKTGRPQLQTQVRLYRDGRTVFVGKLSSFDPGRNVDMRALQAAGRLQLGKEIAPGEYVLQVIVTDLLDKRRIATQWTDFEIIR